MPPTFRERATSMFSLKDDYNFTSRDGRIELWKRGIDHIIARPINGVGAFNFPFAEGRWFEDHGTVGAWAPAHNAFLQAFVELGVVGGAMWVGIVVLSLKAGWRLWVQDREQARRTGGRAAPIAFAAFGAYFVAIFFLSHALTYVTFGMFAVGAAVEAVAMARGRAPGAVRMPQRRRFGGSRVGSVARGTAPAGGPTPGVPMPGARPGVIQSRGTAVTRVPTPGLPPRGGATGGSPVTAG
jgi:hypothetical protein